MAERGKLSVISLGGVTEIGKNMTVVEYGDDIVVVDAGVAFPGDDLPGIDLVIPDITYLLQNAQKVRGIVLTHGHEDHIGSLPYVLRQLPVPLYGTKLTLGLVQRKLKEHNIDVKMHAVQPGKDRVRLGQIEVEYLPVTHSIPDGCGLAIHTPAGLIVHTGDFKIDQTPVDGRTMDIRHFSEMGDRNVLLMMCDTTNATRPSITASERVVGQTFNKYFAQSRQRIIVATFASNIHRIQQVLDAAAFYGRKVAVVGRSMENTVEVARDLGYLNIPENTMVDLEETRSLQDREVVIITTGSQGEPMAALTRMANGSHRNVQIHPGDMVIISATPIPGNERGVSRTIDNLYRLGAEVVYSDRTLVHVSGHGSQEDLRLMLNMVRPRYVIPFHGEYHHMVAFGELAQQHGIPDERIVRAEIGDRISFVDGELLREEPVPSGRVLIDGSGVGDVGNIVLRDRVQLGESGFLVAVMVISKALKKVVSGPDIVTRGFVYVRESDDLIRSATRIVRHRLHALEEEGKLTNWSRVKDAVKSELTRYFNNELGRSPTILPIVMEV